MKTGCWGRAEERIQVGLKTTEHEHRVYGLQNSLYPLSLFYSTPSLALAYLPKLLHILVIFYLYRSRLTRTNDPQLFLTLLQCIFWSSFLRKLRSMYLTWNVLYTLCIYVFTGCFVLSFFFFFFIAKRSLSLLIKVSVSSQANMYIYIYIRCSCIHINKKIARIFIIILIHPSRTNYYIKWYFTLILGA